MLPSSALDLSEAAVASMLAAGGALVLASRLRASIALFDSVDDVSEAAVASQLAPRSALALASQLRASVSEVAIGSLLAPIGALVSA